MKRLGDTPSPRLRNDPDPSETGNNLSRMPRQSPTPAGPGDRRHSSFVDFLSGFVSELNRLSSDGWAVLVEGKRDALALKRLGYTGHIVPSSSTRKVESALRGHTGVVILTDTDAEGRRLASKYYKTLAHAGLNPSLRERRELLAASKGVFRHVENLGRFAEPKDV